MSFGARRRPITEIDDQEVEDGDHHTALRRQARSAVTRPSDEQRPRRRSRRPLVGCGLANSWAASDCQSPERSRRRRYDA